MRSVFRYLLSACLLLLTASSTALAESVRLAWDPSPDVVAAYVVLHGTKSGTYTKETLVAGTTTTADIQNLTVGTTYYFVVKAVDASGMRSAPTNQVSVSVTAPTTPSTPPPPPPETETPTEPTPLPVGMPSGSALRPVPEVASPSGTIVKVSTTTQLAKAVKAIKSNTTIVLAKGTYKLSATLKIAGAFKNIGLRGATANAADVTIVGPGLTSSTGALDGIRTAGGITGLTVANLTLKGFPGTPLVLQDAHTVLVHNVRVYSDGRFLIGGSTKAGTQMLAGAVQYSRFFYEGARTDYRSGVDLQRAGSWRIRYNVFTNPAPSSVQRLGPAVVAWQASSHTQVDGNTFVNCSREIVLGMSKATPNPHTGGWARNNMIVRSTAVKGGGTAISVLDSPSTSVIFNTVLLQGTAPLAIEYRYPDTTRTIVANNLTDAPVDGLEGATGVEDTNVTTAKASWFASASTGDLRLVSTATVPVDAAAAIASVPDDHGGQARPYGGGRDVGADEARTFVYPQ